ncbi:MAG: aldo/keto reductase [Chloroflexi bacterium]|nr:aldo/keto reductase [Chloroflexota bacterium]
MKYTQLGDTNLQVSEFCLGTMMFGGKTAEDESIRIIRRAIDAGVNFIDTANVYNAGTSEEIVGRGLEGLRDRVVLASKVGMQMGEAPNEGGVSRFHIVRSVEASLRRLRTDRIDLFYLHWPMEAMHLEETLRAIEDLVRAGKILYPACSNFPAWLLMRSLWIEDLRGYAPIIAGQYPYNLIERGLEVEVLPAARAMGVGIVVYRPLSAGALTGKYLDAVPSGARGEQDDRLEPWTQRYEEGIRKLRDLAQDRGHTTADAAIAWVRSHPAVTAPIVGISRLQQLEDNLKGFGWEMTPEEREEIAGFFPTAVWEEAGGQFPPWRRSYDIIPR